MWGQSDYIRQGHTLGWYLFYLQGQIHIVSIIKSGAEARDT